jgi:hypothetical protein
VVGVFGSTARARTTRLGRPTPPFPQTIAIDEVRRAFLAYGLSGTPTFVLVDGQGIVRSHATGYDSQKGLGIDGWTWPDRPAQKP